MQVQGKEMVQWKKNNRKKIDDAILLLTVRES